MPSPRSLWRRLLRVLNRQSHGSRWVEPSNAITRAVYGGAALATLEAWPQVDVFEETMAEAPPMEAQDEAAVEVTTPASEPQQEDRPKRPGVAA